MTTTTILFALAGLVACALYWVWLRALCIQAGEIAGATDEVQVAAFRVDYRCKAGVHPVDTIEDPRIAGAAILIALAEVEGRTDPLEQQSILREARRLFATDAEETDAIVAVAAWIVAQCGGAQGAMGRLPHRLRALAQDKTSPELQRLADMVTEQGEIAAAPKSAGLRPVGAA